MNLPPETANAGAPGDSRTFALHTITGLPLDSGFPLFRHYPAMKLGVRESVRFYANLLAPAAEKIMAGRPETTEWVITAPALYVIPAGANLLAWEIFRILNENPGRSLRFVDLRYSLSNPRSQDFTTPGYNYASSGIPERINNRRRLFEGKWAPKPDPADFQDRAVLLINDINVTGTHQHFLHRVLETARPASIDWLYIIQVDAALGRAHPELESALSHLCLESFEDFAAIVARADFDYTWRCIDRLFSHPELLPSLDETRRETLRQLVVREGACDEAKLLEMMT